MVPVDIPSFPKPFSLLSGSLIQLSQFLYVLGVSYHFVGHHGALRWECALLFVLVSFDVSTVSDLWQ